MDANKKKKANAARVPGARQPDIRAMSCRRRAAVRAAILAAIVLAAPYSVARKPSAPKSDVRVTWQLLSMNMSTEYSSL
jgi:hypothetical protein